MAVTVLVPKTRRTQEERTTAMRTRLLDATIDCLCELGYAGTSTVEVARRAGVSRGAQLHHFPTKADLVISAIEHVHDRRLAEFREIFEALPADTDRGSAAIDLLWAMFEGRDFYANLELWVAARTDTDLRKALERLSRVFHQQIIETARDLFPPADAQRAVLLERTLDLTFCFMEGMAVDRIVHRDPAHRDELLAFWKAIIARLDTEVNGGNHDDSSRSRDKGRVGARVARPTRTHRRS